MSDNWTDARMSEHTSCAEQVVKLCRHRDVVPAEDVYQDAWVAMLELKTTNPSDIINHLNKRYKLEREWAKRRFRFRVNDPRYPKHDTSANAPRPSIYAAIAKPESKMEEVEAAIAKLGRTDQSIVRMMLPPYEWTTAKIAHLRGSTEDQIQKRIVIIKKTIAEELKWMKATLSGTN